MTKIILTLLLIICLSSSSQAALTKTRLKAMGQKLHKLVAPYKNSSPHQNFWCGDKVGIYFIDLKTGRKFQINGRKKFPAASAAKIAVMAAAYHMAESGKLNLNKRIILQNSDKLSGSGVLRWMKAGNVYSIRNLVRLMIVKSDNTATKMLIDQIGLAEINKYLKKIKLNKTRIVDRTMLKEEPKKDINLTSPENMARLCADIKTLKYFSYKSARQMLSFMRKQKYRWGIWKGVPKGIKIANKTGNLDKVLNDVGIVYSPSGNYVISIFTYGFSKKREARKLINKISEVVYQEYEHK
jgi:beta-lactamase class A